MLDAGPFLTGNSNADPELNTTGSFARVLTAESAERESLGETVRPRYSREDSPSSYELAKRTGEAVTQAYARVGAVSKEFAEKRLGPLPMIWRSCQGVAARIVNSQTAGIFFAMVVLTNSVYLGVHLSWSSQNPEQTSNSVFLTVHIAYSVLFTLEAVLHFVAVGPSAYICGSSWAWNWLDLFVVTSSWIELAVDIVSPDQQQPPNHEAASPRPVGSCRANRPSGEALPRTTNACVLAPGDTEVTVLVLLALDPDHLHLWYPLHRCCS